MEKTIRELQAEAHTNAAKKGWWDKPVSFGDCCANFHGEISEAFEAFKDGYDLNEIRDIPGSECCAGGPRKPEGIPVELADCVIRIMDFCGKHGIDLQAAIERKMDFNCYRPYRHGNKVV